MKTRASSQQRRTLAITPHVQSMSARLRNRYINRINKIQIRNSGSWYDFFLKYINILYTVWFFIVFFRSTVLVFAIQRTEITAFLCTRRFYNAVKRSFFKTTRRDYCPYISKRLYRKNEFLLNKKYIRITHAQLTVTFKKCLIGVSKY